MLGSTFRDLDLDSLGRPWNVYFLKHLFYWHIVDLQRCVNFCCTEKRFTNTYIRCYCCAQSSLTLCNPMDCSLPGSSVHGISQAGILEWVPICSSRASSQPRDRIHVSCVSCIARKILYHCTIWEALYVYIYNSSKFFILVYYYYIEYSSLYIYVLYSRILLFIHSVYYSLYLLVPNSQSIPPPRLCLGNDWSVYYICESIFVSYISSFVS